MIRINFWGITFLLRKFFQTIKFKHTVLDRMLIIHLIQFLTDIFSHLVKIVKVVLIITYCDYTLIGQSRAKSLLHTKESIASMKIRI